MIKRILFVVLILASATMSAQRNNSSPYSSFGIGQEFTPKTVEQASMGGIGVAFKSDYQLNFINPAGNADLRLTTYALGGLSNFLTVDDGNATQSGSSTSLNYLAIGFPITKKSGFVAGLQPSTSVGYSILSQEFDEDGELLEVSRFKGEGGTSRLYGSFGIYLIKGLSVGIEAGFVFGTIDNSILNQRDEVHLGTKYDESIRVRGTDFKLGLQYKTTLKNKLEISSGIAVKLANDLSQNGSHHLYSLSFSSGGFEIPRDTLSSGSINREVTNPMKTTVGFGLGKKDKWYVGINSEYQSEFENAGNSDQDSHRFGSGLRTSIGGFYIPKINSISNYFERITYRAGIRVERVGLQVDGTGTGNNFGTINDFGINFGLGLPMPKQISSLNIGFEYGQKGTTNNNLIKEEYFNLRLSLSLNSTGWFRKRQID